MKIYDFQEEKQKRSTVFPNPGTIEGNLKPGEKVFRFNTECYHVTKKAILIWRDIWLPRSFIKIVWGELQLTMLM